MPFISYLTYKASVVECYHGSDASVVIELIVADALCIAYHNIPNVVAQVVKFFVRQIMVYAWMLHTEIIQEHKRTV